MTRNRTIPTAGIFLLVPLAFAWAQATPTGGDKGAPAAPTAAGATPAEATPPAPPTEAEMALDEAAKKVAAIKSVSAELEQSVDMLKQQFKIVGRYLKAPGEKVYLLLDVKGLPGSSGQMLQVSDGTTLWDVQQLLESKYYRKYSLAPILEKMKSAELDPAARELVTARYGIAAGPEALLLGLRKEIHFDQKEEGTLDGRPVWILRGTWQNRNGLLGPNQQPLPPTAPLPSYVPSQATLYVGKEDGWPYKVRLAGRMPTVLQDTRRIGPDGRPIGSRSSIQTIEPSVIELAYKNVTLDPAFKGDEFDYQAPAGVKVDDTTETIVGELEQLIQMKIAQKKAESAKNEPLLDQSIAVPKAAPPASTGPPPASPPEASPPPTSPPLAQPPR